MTASKAAEAGYIKEFTVMSNDNKGNISMVGGLVNFQYFGFQSKLEHVAKCLPKSSFFATTLIFSSEFHI